MYFSLAWNVCSAFLLPLIFCIFAPSISYRTLFGFSHMAIKVGVQPGNDAFAILKPILDWFEHEGKSVELVTVAEPWAALEQKKIELFVVKANSILYKIDTPPLFVSRRASLREVIVAKDKTVQLENFAGRWKIGVFASLHEALLKRYFGHIDPVLIEDQIVDPLALLASSHYDGLMMPQASVDRLGLNAFVTQRGNPHTFPPALGRGLSLAFGGEGTLWGTQARNAMHRRSEEEAWACEKQFAQLMPQAKRPYLFGVASVIGDSISMRGGWISPDGKQMLQTEVSMPAIKPKVCAQMLADKLQKIEVDQGPII